MRRSPTPVPSSRVRSSRRLAFSISWRARGRWILGKNTASWSESKMYRLPFMPIALLAVLVALIASPACADDTALQAQVDALRASIAEQRVQLETQARLLDAQQAQLESLTKQLGQSKVSVPEAPKLAFSNNRPT